VRFNVADTQDVRAETHPHSYFIYFNSGTIIYY